MRTSKLQLSSFSLIVYSYLSWDNDFTHILLANSLKTCKNLYFSRKLHVHSIVTDDTEPHNERNKCKRSSDLAVTLLV